MEAIVWHKGFACKVVRSGYRVRLWESPDSGQREVVVYPRKLFMPVDQDAEQGPCTWADFVGYDGLNLDVDLDEMARRAERDAATAAGRARRNCRAKVKHAGFKQLLTLTYRVNMGDLSRMRADFARWLRVMRRLIPGFRAVYGFEQQERGAWHCHVATDRLPRLMQYRGLKVQSWKVGTAVWRSVQGDGGLCFVGGRKGTFNRDASPARIAGYIAKYLTKDNAAGEHGRRMWDSTRDLTPPAALTIDLPSDATLLDAITLAFELRAGDVIVRHALLPDRDMWMLYTEPDPGSRTAPEKVVRGS